MDQEGDSSNSTPQKLLVTGLINLSFVFMVRYLINLYVFLEIHRGIQQLQSLV